MESKSKLFWTSGVLFMHVFVVTVLCQKKNQQYSGPACLGLREYGAFITIN